ncbi:MAG TPA: condensation domain-containing protein, partial [Myxococcaceae bacterium]|nr:condensation domain-containing protein [Myxococcaceae bacterium]
AEGEPVQVVQPAAPHYRLVREDLGALGAQAREAAVLERVRADAREGFDLERGPLFRARLLRLEAAEHVLLLCMHHIVSDGWSLGVLFRELGVLYGAYRRGEASPLEELAYQYADYALWQRRHLAGEVLEEQLSYWRGQLSAAPALLELPGDRPRPAVQGHRGGLRGVLYGAELREELRGLARREGATLFMVLLAGFQMLLSRYAGQEDVVVGTPIAGRTRAEVEGLIGLFVNTLVLRTDLSGDPTFGELLRRVREVTLGAYAHQELPFEKLVEELKPERSLSHGPLFQVMFALQNHEEERPALEGLQVQRVGAESETAKFDLMLVMAEGEDGLWAGLEYDVELFDASTVERMLEHLRVLLEGICAGPQRRIGEIELLGPGERRQVVEEWSRTAVDHPEADTPGGGLVHGLFEAQARRSPGAVAVVHEGEALTYAELEGRANRLAHHLRVLGVGPEVRVGVCVERSVEMVVALLGVLKAGGAYVPLDPAYPAERLRYMLEDSGASVLLAQEHLLEGLPESSAALVCLDRDRESIGAQPSGAPALELPAEAAAYVIYTSGSTGRPKGVVVTHANVVRLFGATEAWFGFGAEDVWTLFHSCAFDFSVWELWGALLHGGRLVVVPYLT